VDISVDWSRADLIDAGVDIFGLVANGTGIVAAAIPGGQAVAVGAEGVGAVVEGAGLIKSGYELLRGDPSSLIMQQTTNSIERFSVMVFRTERMVPGIGFVGNLVSLQVNLKPQITVKWVTP
jgi:hypothetical protein